MKHETPSVPVIDIRPLVQGSDGRQAVANQIGEACRTHGFFYIVGHGVSEELQQRLEAVSHRFFAQDEAEKLRIGMAQGGKAWRGYFPLGGELTSGQPDLKEGLYFGEELGLEDPRVQAGLPMHGANLFPDAIPGFREAVLEYLEALTDLGHTLMHGISLSLGLEETYFSDHYTADPLILFRIFHYPPSPRGDEQTTSWGVGEHTDYGVLTILKQDRIGGLQVKTRAGWIEAPPIDNAFTCNIGDMLDRITRGLYRSTPHRVLNRSQQSRFSYPFFFDPGFDAQIAPVDLSQAELPGDDRQERWDQASVHEFQGTYGDYILSKVSKVFPELRRGVL